MRRLLLLLILLTPSCPDPADTARVIGVSDGDTLTVLQGRTQTRIRLHGIDAGASCYLASYPSFNEEVSRISNLDQPAHRTSKEGKGPQHVGKAEAGKIS